MYSHSEFSTTTEIYVLVLGCSLTLEAVAGKEPDYTSKRKTILSWYMKAAILSPSPDESPL